MDAWTNRFEAKTLGVTTADSGRYPSESDQYDGGRTGFQHRAAAHAALKNVRERGPRSVTGADCFIVMVVVMHGSPSILSVDDHGHDSC
jgi:hypothetical protein